MKTVILAGGRGSRLGEETSIRPKPMVEIGGRPILWHIMQLYGAVDFTDFVIALGYKGDVIKEYFANYALHSSDIAVNLATGAITYMQRTAPPWNVQLIDTGNDSHTGGRLRRLRSYLDDDQPFFMTYGDGLADVNPKALLAFHRAHGKLATMTVVQPPGRFGAVTCDAGGQVTTFDEKPETSEVGINGGFFVLEPQVLDYIDSDATAWEREPLTRLVRAGELMGYRHDGYWQCMDTPRDRETIEAVWQQGSAPWMR